MIVDLPAPLGPSKQVTSPAFAESETPLSASILPYDVARSVISSMMVRVWSVGKSWKMIASGSRSLVCSEIGGSHLCVLLNLRWRTFGDLPAEIQYGDAVAHTHHQFHMVFN